MAKKKKAIKVKRAAVILLFESLGFKTAKQWTTKRITDKIKRLPEITDGVKIKDKKVREILEVCLKARKVRIIDEQEEVEEKKATKAVESSKKRTTEKKAEKKPAKENKPGLMMSMYEFIKKDGPISAKAILAKLKQRFPNHNPESMERCIPRYPKCLAESKGIKDIKINNKGKYYIKK